MIIFSDPVESYTTYLVLAIHIVITHIICPFADTVCDLIRCTWFSVEPELNACFLIFSQLPVQSAVFYLAAPAGIRPAVCFFFLFDGTHSLSVFFCRFVPQGAFVIYFLAERKRLFQRRFIPPPFLIYFVFTLLLLVIIYNLCHKCKDFLHFRFIFF